MNVHKLNCNFVAFRNIGLFYRIKKYLMCINSTIFFVFLMSSSYMILFSDFPCTLYTVNLLAACFVISLSVEPKEKLYSHSRLLIKIILIYNYLYLCITLCLPVLSYTFGKGNKLFQQSLGIIVNFFVKHWFILIP